MGPHSISWKGIALSNLVEVTVLVPEELLPRFYAHHARFLRKGGEHDCGPRHGGRHGDHRFGSHDSHERGGRPEFGQPDPRGEFAGPRGDFRGPRGGRGEGHRRPFGDGRFDEGFRGRGPGAISAAERSEIWAQGSDAERLEDARIYYAMLRDNARRFLDLLIDDQRDEVPATEIIETLGLDSNRVLAGSLSSFGFAARRLGRSLPFGWEVKTDGSTVYSITPDVADLFKQVRPSVAGLSTEEEVTAEA